MEKLFLCLLFSVIFVTAIKDVVGVMDYRGERLLKGDIVSDKMNATQCSKISGSYFTQQKCYCGSNKPIFHMDGNNKRVCYYYLDLCRECNSYQEASSTKIEDIEILTTIINGTLKNVLSQCPINDRITAVSILKNANYFVQVYVGGMVYDEGESKVTIKLQVNETLSPILLKGKLARMQIWCRNSSEEEISVNREKEAIFLKISGNFTYPDTDIYVVMTTTTTTLAPVVLPNKGKEERKGSKNMIFYVVVPVAAFMLIVAIVLLCLNCRAKSQKKHSYTLEKLDEDQQEKNNGDLGMFNPAYQNSTLAKGAATSSINNNESTKKNPPRDEIKIYTVVDLSQRPIHELPVTRMEPESGPYSYEQRSAIRPNHVNLLDESLKQQHQGQMNVTLESNLSDSSASSEKDDISIKKIPDDGDDTDQENSHDVKNGTSGDDNNSIRKDSVSSYDEDGNQLGGEESVDDSVSYHSDGDDDIDVEIMKPPPMIDEIPKDNDDEEKSDKIDFVIIGDKLI